MKTPYHFSSKWSAAVDAQGFTAVPNLLVRYQGDLNITDAEMSVLIAILSFKWTNAMPYPSASTIGEYIGKSVNSVRDKLRSLEDKGLIERIPRPGTSNEYNLTPLDMKLRTYAHPIENSIPVYRKQSGLPYREFETKEEALKKTKIKRRTKNSGKPTPAIDVLRNQYPGIAIKR